MDDTERILRKLNRHAMALGYIAAIVTVLLILQLVRH